MKPLALSTMYAQQERFEDGSWVEVRGRFVESGDGWILQAESAKPIEQPAEPYVY